jgi:nucleoside-diphosphate-sugar epimerase
MCPTPDQRHILVTGGCGFLGRYVSSVLRHHFPVVSFDVKNTSDDESFFEGSVTNANDINAAMAGAFGLVIAHMAPRAPGVYDSPEIPFDINVKGTAMLFDAAIRHGIQRVVLISSISVFSAAQISEQYLTGDLTPIPDSIYGLTKSHQEQVALHYYLNHGLETAILRPAYISLGENLEDKYGVKRASVNWQFIDPRDIGAAAYRSLVTPDLACEIFHLVAGPGAEEKTDVRRTMEHLSWTPHFRFTEFPLD